MAAAKLFHRAQRQVKVPTYLVPATQTVSHMSRLLQPPTWCPATQPVSHTL